MLRSLCDSGRASRHDVAHWAVCAAGHNEGLKQSDSPGHVDLQPITLTGWSTAVRARLIERRADPGRPADVKVIYLDVASVASAADGTARRIGNDLMGTVWRARREDESSAL